MGNGLKATGIRLRSLGRLANLIRVDAVSQLRFSFQSPVTGGFQGDIRVNAHGKGLPLAVEPLIQPPPFSTFRGGQQVEAAAVGK